MKNIIKISLSISGFCLILLAVLICVSQVQAQTTDRWLCRRIWVCHRFFG
jgi:hypothetical protein